MSLYGQLVTIEDVRHALTAHLELWAPAYIAEVGRQRGIDLPEFRGFGFETTDAYPVCITACAGTDGQPERHGDGTVTASYPVVAAAVVSGVTRESATALAGYYGAAIRGAVLQHAALGGFSAETTWTGESIQEVAFDSGQSIMSCHERFTILVDSTVNTLGGPAIPPNIPGLPPGDYPQVTLVDPQILHKGR